MRKICISILASSLAACAAPGPQTQLYRPYGDTGPAWTISGEFNPITDDLQVFVNGELAAAGDLWYSTTPGTVSGSYEGHPVRAECAEYQAASGGTLMALCDVFIDDERAAFLSFG